MFAYVCQHILYFIVYFFICNTNTRHKQTNNNLYSNIKIVTCIKAALVRYF